MTMQSSQYTSPFLQFKLSKPNKVEKPQHQMKHNSHNKHSVQSPQQFQIQQQSHAIPPFNPIQMQSNPQYMPPVFSSLPQTSSQSPPPQNSFPLLPPPPQHQFAMSQYPPSNFQQQQHQYIATQPEKKVKKAKRTQSPPIPSGNQQPAYIHWKFNESFDNTPPQQSTSTASSSISQKSTKRSKKVKYGCLAFSLSDCTLVNNVNYQRPHHNTNNTWLPSSNNIHNYNIVQSSQPTSPIESKESNLLHSNNSTQLHGILNYSNGSESSNNHQLAMAKNPTNIQESPLTSVETSLSPNQVSPRVIRTNISIKDILN